jgi:hypothetical protein
MVGIPVRGALKLVRATVVLPARILQGALSQCRLQTAMQTPKRADATS